MRKIRYFYFLQGAASPKLSGNNPYFARNYPSTLAESEAAANYVINNHNMNKVAVIYVTNDYGLGLQSKFEATIKKADKNEIVLSEGYNFGNTQFRNIIIKIKQINPDVIYLAGNQRRWDIS